MALNIRDLEYFAVLADQGHVGRAAEVLGLSQPALSKCLRRLEAEVDAKLVKRTPRGLALTSVGEVLRMRAHRLRLSLADVVHEAADVSQGRSGSLRVGAGAGMGDEFLAEACSTLMMEAPKVTLTLSVAPNAMLLPALRNGEYDLVVSGITKATPDDLAQEKLYEDEYVVYCSPNHRLAKRKKIGLRDLANERWVLAVPNDLSWIAIHRAFEDHGLTAPRVAVAITASTIRMGVVATSDLLGFASWRVLRGAGTRFPLARLRIEKLSWARTVGVSYRKDAYLSPAARRFIDILGSKARGS